MGIRALALAAARKERRFTAGLREKGSGTLERGAVRR
jgi:hypothetical protein